MPAISPTTPKTLRSSSRGSTNHQGYQGSTPVAARTWLAPTATPRASAASAAVTLVTVKPVILIVWPRATVVTVGPAAPRAIGARLVRSNRASRQRRGRRLSAMTRHRGVGGGRVGRDGAPAARADLRGARGGRVVDGGRPAAPAHRGHTDAGVRARRVRCTSSPRRALQARSIHQPTRPMTSRRPTSTRSFASNSSNPASRRGDQAATRGPR
jgi:hypothetical protein